jgi:demethylmenaquinone methyltransferase/2-methoxy-6-polyprenyl-1,4-benzoquinol methylase
MAPVLKWSQERPVVQEGRPTLPEPDLPRSVFSPIARNYDHPALMLSLFQYRRWHRFLLARLELPAIEEGHILRVLDMATGAGALALDLAAQPGVEVVGGDITRAMLTRALARAARNGVANRPAFLECSAERPPFKDGAFDALVFAYLLRYVSDVSSTLCCLAALVRPGGTIASLDFAVPHGVAYPFWRLYTGLALPLGGRVFSDAWRRTGSFLGPNIRDFYRRWPEERLLRAWRDAGITEVQSKRLSLGGAIVIWGRKAA